MYRTVPLLLVAAMVVVVTLPTAESVKCYVCSGYNPKQPDEDVSNTESCQQDTFNKTAILIGEGKQCQAVIRNYDGVRITERSTYNKDIPSKRDANDYVTLTGYLCSTDLCNDQDPDNAAAATTLCLPLLALLSLLTLLPHRVV